MRILFAAFFLFLAGCATTGVDTAPVEEEPVIAVELGTVSGSAAITGSSSTGAVSTPVVAQPARNRKNAANRILKGTTLTIL